MVSWEVVLFLMVKWGQMSRGKVLCYVVEIARHIAFIGMSYLEKELNMQHATILSNRFARTLMLWGTKGSYFVLMVNLHW